MQTDSCQFGVPPEEDFCKLQILKAEVPKESDKQVEEAGPKKRFLRKGEGTHRRVYSYQYRVALDSKKAKTKLQLQNVTEIDIDKENNQNSWNTCHQSIHRPQPSNQFQQVQVSSEKFFSTCSPVKKQDTVDEDSSDKVDELEEFRILESKCYSDKFTDQGLSFQGLSKNCKSRRQEAQELQKEGPQTIPEEQYLAQPSYSNIYVKQESAKQVPGYYNKNNKKVNFRQQPEQLGVISSKFMKQVTEKYTGTSPKHETTCNQFAKCAGHGPQNVKQPSYETEGDLIKFQIEKITQDQQEVKRDREYVNKHRQDLESAKMQFDIERREFSKYKVAERNQTSTVIKLFNPACSWFLNF